MNKVNLNDAKDFDNSYKIGLVVMQDDTSDMHITLLSSLMNKGEDKMMFGEFIVGLSKDYIHKNPKTGFFIMNMNKEFWTGKMEFLPEVKTEGEDYIKFNSMPLYRFNTYFGINKVHFADLIDISLRAKLDMGGIIKNALRVTFKKPFMAGDKDKKVLKPWAESLTAKLDTLMFIGYMGEDGYPKMVPIIQGQSATSSRIVFTDKPYKEMLTDLKDNARVAIFIMNLDMETVLVKGNFHGFKKGFGYVDIDKVYNSMPPKHGYIYPAVKQIAVESF
ncbi:MAG: hypothetical protein JJE17_06750 [Peptostreptococcaceae bacterium]|nr:hypothetical protein [Peptostreptococcaceae bacterium]